MVYRPHGEGTKEFRDSEDYNRQLTAFMQGKPRTPETVAEWMRECRVPEEAIQSYLIKEMKSKERRRRKSTKWRPRK